MSERSERIMGRMFGTDGVRGLANQSLSPELALRVASAAAAVLGPAGGLAVVGRDPRVSGEMLEAAVTAGLAAGGLDVLPVGVLPTPAVAYLTGTRGAVLGVMISASHNPMPDNGIKIFAAGGHKLDDDVEDQIEALVHGGTLARPTGAGVGRVRPFADAVDEYVAHLVSSAGSLTGVKVVVDCAHGAASVVAPAVYRAAGAEVIAIHAEPTGLNINDNCGSTHLGALRQAVIAHGADLGIGLDGDADRCLAIDADGNVVDGDHIMAVLALAMNEAGTLVNNTLVTTVMSNVGLHTAMRAAGIRLRTTAVGDRYVLEELRSGGFNLGGEQSGHMIFPDFGTTGDGTLTGLRLMARMVETGKQLAELAAVMTTVPQVLVNVPVTDKNAAVAAAAVLDAVAQAERILADSGRVLLRPSGTEQLVRVMVEAPDPAQARQLADDLAKVVASL